MAGAFIFIFRLFFESQKGRDERYAKERKARKALVSAVHKQVKPHIRALGFASAQTDAWRSSKHRSWLSGVVWIRMRGDRVDLLTLYWEKGGDAMFQLSFSSQDVDDWNAIRWGEHCNFGSLHANRDRPTSRHWFGVRQTPDEAAALAIQRLDELDRYLNDGTPSRFIKDRG